MPNRLLDCGQGLIATLAATSGFAASIAASLPETSQIEAIAKWPLTVVLGAVCCFCIWINFKQSSRHSLDLIAMAEGERLAAEKRTIAHATATKELAEFHAREITTLLNEIVQQRNP
jgi:hypothetical protein